MHLRNNYQKVSIYTNFAKIAFDILIMMMFYKVSSLRLMTRSTSNSSLPGQNGHSFTDDDFECIFVNEKFCILNKISLNLSLRVHLTITHHWFR